LACPTSYSTVSRAGSALHRRPAARLKLAALSAAAWAIAAHSPKDFAGAEISVPAINPPRESVGSCAFVNS
jgi:hypothetical protein